MAMILPLEPWHIPVGFLLTVLIAIGIVMEIDAIDGQH